jgi:hypothetical protein
MDILMRIVDAVFGFVDKLPDGLLPAIVIAIPVTMMVLHLRWWFRRGPQWEAAAMELGLSRIPGEASLAALFPALDVFAEDDMTKEDNPWIHAGTSGGFHVWLGDHSSRIRKGRTVCVLRSPGAEWPAMHLFGGRGRPVPDGEVTLPAEPDFARGFKIRGKDPEAARRLLSPVVCAALLRLSARCREIERAANSMHTRLMLWIFNQIGLLEIETAGDVFAVCASCYLDPAAAKDLLAAVQEACLALPRARPEE